MRWVIVILLGVFVVLQYQLWFGAGGIAARHRLQHHLKQVQATNLQQKSKNNALAIKIRQFKKNPNAAESYARSDLGMIKKGEVFYRFNKP